MVTRITLGAIPVINIYLHYVMDFYSHSTYVLLFLKYWNETGNTIDYLTPNKFLIYDDAIKKDKFKEYARKYILTGSFDLYYWIQGQDVYRAIIQGELHHDLINLDENTEGNGMGSVKPKGSIYTYHEFAKGAALKHTIEILKSIYK